MATKVCFFLFQTMCEASVQPINLNQSQQNLNKKSTRQ
jgi:hypothetical protein